MVRIINFSDRSFLYLVVTLTFLIFLLPGVSAASCSITSSCAPDYTLMRLSALSNGLIGLWNETSMPYYVCCDFPGTHECTWFDAYWDAEVHGVYNSVLWLSASKNAVADSPPELWDNRNMNTRVCYGNLTAISIMTNACTYGRYPIELFSLTNNPNNTYARNARAGEFSAHPIKVCGGFTDCGDGIMNRYTGSTQGREQCDNGPQNGVVCNNFVNGVCTYCSSDCQIVENRNDGAPYCGDGNCDLCEDCRCKDCANKNFYICNDYDTLTIDGCGSITNYDIDGKCDNPRLRDTVCLPDSDLCTNDVFNDAFECVHIPKNCNDNNPCTADSCSFLTGCVHTQTNCKSDTRCVANASSPGCVMHLSFDEGAGNIAHDSCGSNDGVLSSGMDGNCYFEFGPKVYSEGQIPFYRFNIGDGQSFVAEHNSLREVAFSLSHDFQDIFTESDVYKYTFQIREGSWTGNVLGTSHVIPGPLKTDNQPYFIHYGFSPSVTLVPGRTYYIVASNTTKLRSAGATYLAEYPQGFSYRGGVQRAQDWHFRVIYDNICGSPWRPSSECVSGSCLSFNGIDDFVEVPDSPSLNPDSITIMAWVSSDEIYIDHPGGEVVISKDPEPFYDVRGYSITLTSWNTVNESFQVPRFYAQSGSSSMEYVTVYGGTVEPDKVWHHVAAVYNGTFRSVYVNGVFTPDRFYRINATGPINDFLGSLVIGRSSVNEIPRFFRGKIDEVKIYDRGLSPQEIFDEYKDSAKIPTCEIGYTLCGSNCDVTSRSCAISDGTILIGVGDQSRTCNNNTWSNWSSCILDTCTPGFDRCGTYCNVSTRYCPVPNGAGIQSMTCNAGVWSAWSACNAISCNPGYYLCGGTCRLPSQMCPIPNGIGFQKGSCTNNVWTWDTCKVSLCNPGFMEIPNTNTCDTWVTCQ